MNSSQIKKLLLNHFEDNYIGKEFFQSKLKTTRVDEFLVGSLLFNKLNLIELGKATSVKISTKKNEFHSDTLKVNIIILNETSNTSINIEFSVSNYAFISEKSAYLITHLFDLKLQEFFDKEFCINKINETNAIFQKDFIDYVELKLSNLKKQVLDNNLNCFQNYQLDLLIKYYSSLNISNDNLVLKQ